MSNLRATASKLQDENQSLRNGPTSQDRLMDIILSDPAVEVDSPDQFAERYVALKTRLEADLEEFKIYKNKVQQLQNQLIKANDREKNFLNATVSNGKEELKTKQVDKERQKIKKLENSVIQREKVIENLERSLADFLERTERGKSVQSVRSYSSSRTGSDTQQEPVTSLTEENARLREELEEWRLHMQQEDLRNSQLHAQISATEDRIQSLEIQMKENALEWSQEKRELNVRLQERSNDFTKTGSALGIDVAARQSF